MSALPEQGELIVLKFPPPPPPPVDTSQLESLAEYYRQLVDYYRRASEIASQQLSHVEALLHPIELLGFPSKSNENCWLETHNSNGSPAYSQGYKVPQLSATVAQESHPNEGEEEPSQPDEFNQKTEEELFALLATELESNRGKMLHLDYLVREIYGALDGEKLESARGSTRSLLEKGANQQKWVAVPDAPDCWTIDKSEFPDLTEPLTKSSSSLALRKVLVGSERLDRYATVTEAIAACLEKQYPDSMSTKQIVDYFYPEGVLGSRWQKVHNSLSKALSEGNNKFWRREKVGQYIWKKS